MTAVQSFENRGGVVSNPWKPYPAYKASGVEWLGTVPQHWDVKRLKYSASINDDALPETTDPDFEFDYVDIGSVNAAAGITTKERMVFDSAPSRARRRVKIGDTIVSTVRTYLRAIAPIRDSAETMIVSTGFAVVRPRKVESSYLAYALREASFVESIVARSTGVSYPAVNAAEVGCIAIPLPSPPEQRAIAVFLDRETRKIDRLVAKKQELLEKLSEERITLVSRTVTRGLNPKVKLKHSGVDWLGEVPEHWQVKAIKWETPVFRGASPRPIDDPAYFDEDGEFAWVRISDVTGAGMYLVETEQKLSVLGCSLSVKLLPGALFLSIAGSVGKPCITRIKCCIHDGFVYFPRFSGDQRFLYYIFAGGEPYKGLGKMGTQLNLNTDTVGSIVIGLPQPDEQSEIADYLDRETAKIDCLVKKVKKAIEALQAYRTALITAAVTGKIDVREAAT